MIVFRLFAFKLCMMALGSFGLEAASAKKILIYHSYPPGEWVHGINNSFKATLERLGHEVKIVSTVFHSEHWLRRPLKDQKKEQERLINIVKAASADLVLLCDDEAASFLAKEMHDLGLPIFLTGINQALDETTWVAQIPKGKIAGVLEVYQVSESVGLLKKLKPELKSMSILSSKNFSSKVIAKNLKEIMRSPAFVDEHGVQLRSVHTLRFWEEWKKVLPDLNKNDQAIWILVPYDVRDSHNQEVSIEQIGAHLTKHLSVPTLGVVSIHTKIGLFLALSISPEALGRHSAEQVARFLKGESLKKIGFENARYYKMEINTAEAKRLGVKIPSSLLGAVNLVDAPVLKYGR